MKNRNAVVIGATGDVGRGVCKQLCANDYNVVAVGRSQQKLDELEAALRCGDRLRTLAGSVADESGAEALVARMKSIVDPDVVITTVGGTLDQRSIFDQSTRDIADAFAANVLPHYAAAKAFIPNMKPGSVYIGIGGGMADHILPGMVSMSMSQAALRNFYLHLVKDPACSRIHVRELMLYSIINGSSRRGPVDERWITDDDVGKHLISILSDLAAFDGPILTLKSRRQVGLPQREVTR
jgi:NAD(P)-dependent dehydrogenase (short-subunit alcohol dehydrogenase family)